GRSPPGCGRGGSRRPVTRGWGWPGPGLGRGRGVLGGNFSPGGGRGPAEAATPCPATALTRAAPPTAASSQLILRISYLLAEYQAAAAQPGVFLPPAHTSGQHPRFNRNLAGALADKRTGLAVT